MLSFYKKDRKINNCDNNCYCSLYEDYECDNCNHNSYCNYNNCSYNCKPENSCCVTCPQVLLV